MTAPEILAAGRAEAWLREAWFELRNGANAESRRYVIGGIDIAHAAKLLTDEQAELWKRRIGTCPGHDDESGRDWCAFCGLMPKPGREDTGERGDFGE